MYLLGGHHSIYNRGQAPRNSVSKQDSERMRRDLASSPTEGSPDGHLMPLVLSLYLHHCPPATKGMGPEEEASSPLHCSRNKKEPGGREGQSFKCGILQTAVFWGKTSTHLFWLRLYSYKTRFIKLRQGSQLQAWKQTRDDFN